MDVASWHARIADSEWSGRSRSRQAEGQGLDISRARREMRRYGVHAESTTGALCNVGEVAPAIEDDGTFGKIGASVPRCGAKRFFP
jgi:hypothetical protein